MNTLPSITESAIRERTDTKVMARGRDYYDGDCVLNVVWRDGELWADVEGSAYEPYRVHVTFGGDEITATDCTCPYDWGGDCKHVIAVLLYLAYQRADIESRPSIPDLIDGHDREALAALLLTLVEQHPAIADEIERFLASVDRAVKSDAGGSSTPAVDTDLLYRQIVGDLRGSIQTGYDSWGEERWYDSDLGAALGPAQERVRALLDAGDGENALLVLDVVTQAWDNGANELEDYFLEYFGEQADEYTIELGELWAEAILTAELDEDERLAWAESLQDRSETIFGGGSLEMAAQAAEDGWDAPALVAAMQGNITEKGAWADETPWYADSLASVRLRVLERRGRYQEYLNLAQAEGQFLPYLHMLVKTGQVELAMAEARQHLDRPSDFHALAKTLLDQGDTARAFDLAQLGLSLPTPERRHDWMLLSASGEASLAAWLRDAASAHGQAELALEAAQRALVEETTLANYRSIEQMTGAAWADLKLQTLQIVAKGKGVDGQVDIYLHEKMYAEAIKVVDKADYYHRIGKVIEAVKGEYPDWAFAQCRRQAEAIMDAGRAKDYDVAAEWLRSGRDILLAADKRDKWTACLNGIMEIHQRKYKLMPMLRALR